MRNKIAFLEAELKNDSGETIDAISKDKFFSFMNFLDSIAKESPTGIVSLTPDNTIYVRWVGKTAKYVFHFGLDGRIRHICLPIRENKMRQYNNVGKVKETVTIKFNTGNPLPVSCQEEI